MSGLRTSSFIWLALWLALACAAPRTAPAAAARFRICLDTGPDHLRNLAVRQFAERLETLLPGRFHVQIFDSGQLYNDRDAAKALIWGGMDMALPSRMQLARFEPAANLASLPLFYGLSADVLHEVLDGEVGAAIAQRLERRLPVVVLKPDLDLGYIQLFSVGRPMRAPGDVAAMKIRVPGGAANLRRLQLQGAYPVVIPWSNVPISLSQGNIDAVASTFETVQSGALWDVGIRYVLEDRAMFIQYVPLLRRQFWQKLDAATRAGFLQAWRETMASARRFSAHRQALARAEAVRHGVISTTPTQAVLDAERARLVKYQPALVRELQIPPELVELAQASIARASAKGADPKPATKHPRHD